MKETILQDFLEFIDETYGMSEFDFAYEYNTARSQFDTYKVNKIIDNYIMSKFYDFKDYNDDEPFTFEDFENNVKDIICIEFTGAIPF